MPKNRNVRQVVEKGSGISMLTAPARDSPFGESENFEKFPHMGSTTVKGVLEGQFGPWFERLPLGRGPAARSKPRSGAPQAQGLTARTEPTPSSCGRTHAWFIPSRPELVLPVAQPEFKAQARLRHAAATAASPHIRSALEAPGTMIPRARGHRARKSGTILFGGMSQPENFTITTRPSPAGSP